MSELPFQLLITCNYPEKRTESVKCTALLRSIPGRRNVFDAAWNGKNVIVKVFTHPINAKRHVKREWKGLVTLLNSKINAPTPLFFGQTEKGSWAVVMEKITSSTTVLEMFNNLQNIKKKLELLIIVCRELSLQHKAGMIQKDFHLENFIWAEGKIYTLDAAQMQFFKCEVPLEKSLSNLAMLLLYPAIDDTESKQIVCKEYFEARGWNYDDYQEQFIQKQTNLQRKKSIERGLKKCLRTSKRFIKIKNRNFTTVFDKTFCSETQVPDFLDKIDDMMTKGHILKDGNTCFVSCLTWNKKDIVIKRYNHMGFIHSLRHMMTGSRARHVWLNAQRLIMLSVQTPKPLIYIERYKGALLWNSYIVTEYVDGMNFYYFLKDTNIAANIRIATNKQVEKLLDTMWNFSITHGDLKHSNILIAKNGPVLTDLDSMKIHRINLLHKLNQAKDAKRFYKPYK
jgi:tRNA A-37 threonylcarbamoyl transferase component Bud32